MATARKSTNSAVKKRELYDLDEYKAKALAAIEKLKATPPGKNSGQVGKNDVLASVKSELKALVDAGYTNIQIAQAFQQDVFGILPKSITQILGKRKQVSKRSKSKQQKQVSTASITPPVSTALKATTNEKKQTAKNIESKPGTFSIKADKEDI